MKVKLILLSKDYLKGYNAVRYNNTWYNVTIKVIKCNYYLNITSNGLTIINKAFNDISIFTKYLDRLNIQVL